MSSAPWKALPPGTSIVVYVFAAAWATDSSVDRRARADGAVGPDGPLRSEHALSVMPAANTIRPIGTGGNLGIGTSCSGGRLTGAGGTRRTLNSGGITASMARF